MSKCSITKAGNVWEKYAFPACKKHNSFLDFSKHSFLSPKNNSFWNTFARAFEAGVIVDTKIRLVDCEDKILLLWRKFTYIINILWHKHCFYDRLGSAATMQFILTLISFVATSLIHLYATMSSNEDCLWSFGYGSNMDVKALESKKHVKVIGKKALFVTTCVLSSAG